MFTGVITALVTPLRGDALDEEALRRLVDEQIASGVDGLVPVGTTGESPTLTNEEHLRVIQLVVEAAQEARPGHRRHRLELDARDDRDVGARAQAVGADGLLLVTPYYNRPGRSTSTATSRRSSRRCRCRRILYNVPGRTACDLLPETIARLAELPAGRGRQGGDRLGAARVAGPRAGSANDQVACSRATTPPRSRSTRWARAASSRWSATSRPAR